MDYFNSSEIKYKFKPFGKYYFETEIKPIVEEFTSELADIFFREFFKSVKDKDVNECLKTLEKGFYGRVFDFLDNSQHCSIWLVRDKRKIKKEDLTHLLTIGLYSDFKQEFYRVMASNSDGLYEIEEMM